MMEWKDRFPSYSHTDPFQHGSKYPPVTSRRDRSRYAAVFQDQYGEFSELQWEVGATQAKLQQLEALLLSLPPPRSQKEVRMAAHVRREFEKKQAVRRLLRPQIWLCVVLS